MRLLLVRHGQTFANVQLALDTAHPGADLTPEGQSQAAAVAAHLAGEHVDELVATTLARTQQTAAPIAARLGLAVGVEDRWREISAGDKEMRSDRESFTAYHQSINAWVYGDLDHRMPGGENGREVFDRANAALEALQARIGVAGTAVIVAHGAIIRTWTGYHAANVAPSFAAESLIPNTGIVEVLGEAGQWRCRRWVGRAFE